MFCKKGVLRNFAKLTEKQLCQSLFFNKFPDLRPETLLKKRLWHRCFPVNFAKFLRTPFLIEHLRWLLLIIISILISIYFGDRSTYWHVYFLLRQFSTTAITFLDFRVSGVRLWFQTKWCESCKQQDHVNLSVTNWDLIITTLRSDLIQTS